MAILNEEIDGYVCRLEVPPGITGLAQIGLPTVFVMEGGYAVEDLGVNTVNVLLGYLNGP